MNKKVLTLCAGFLLAGGMLSSLSAEKLSAVADNGKYYKIVRGATYSSSTIGWENEDPRGWFLDLNDANVPGLAKETNDYWKVETVSEENGTYKLVNFSGEELAVETGENVFSFNKDVEKDHGLTQLLFGTNSWVGNEITDPDNDGFFNLAYQEVGGTFTNVHGLAFDAVEESATSGDVNYKMLDEYATDFVYNLNEGEVKAIRFAYNNGNGETLTYWYWDEATQQQKEAEAYDFSTTNVFSVSYDKKTQTYSFTDVRTNKVLIADQVRSFVVKKDDHGACLQDPTSSKFVKLTFSATGVTAELVDTAEEATYVGFQVTSTVGVPVKALNVLEKDGFSVSIYYDKEDNCFEDEEHLASDIEGNYFKGHLTTMVWDAANKKFLSTEDDAAKTIVETYPDRFYLKNSDGKFIVAEQYEGQGSYEYQALYGFTTVTEDELKKYLIRSNDNLQVDEEYFGVFRAEVKEADFDADPTAITKVDQLTSLSVMLDEWNWATVGRYDFTTSKVPTLVASRGTSLYPILISLGDREIVDWRTFVQGKFFTIEKVTKDAKDNGYLVPQVLANGKDYRFEKTYGNVLEGEWALTVEFSDKKQTKAKAYVFTNRENTNITFEFETAQALYYKSGAENTYKYLGDEYVIKAVDTDEFDGYKVLSTDKELNQTWNLAYASDDIFGGKAYLTENHNDAKDAEYHVVGLTTDVEDALKFSVKKYDGKFEKKMNNTSYKYEFHPADTIYVVSELGYYNTKDKAYDTKLDTLKVLAYTFVNQWNEPLAYGDVNANKDQGYRSLVTYKDGDKTLKYADADLAKAHEGAQKFAMRLDGDYYNLRPVIFTRTMQTEGDLSKNWEDEMYQIFNNEADLVKMYAGDASIGITDNVDLYDRTENDLFTFEQTDAEIYRRLVNNVDTISIYRNDNDKSLLYEKTMKINDTTSVNFLGLENIADFTEMAPAMIADTAYVRYDTYKPQYMLVVDPTIHPAGKWCDVCESADCEHAVPTPAWTEGRFLVNLKDSAAAWADAHKHQLGNPYVNEEGYNKLGFVQGIHRNDSLIIASDNKQIFVGDNNDNLAKFQFRYKDITEGSFVIETEGGYLKWMNGVVVVIPEMTYADVYNVNEDESRQPTANEEISVNAAVSVVATDGAVIVKGAEGKNVIVSTILGKVVANEVLNSDNETIAAPAGIVVVSVDGESFKVAVK